MTEQLDLTTPDADVPGITDFSVDQLDLNWGQRRIDIWLLNSNGGRLQHVYRGDEAETLMIALNKADLSASSLHKRILDRLISDGVLVGTVSGVPE